MNKFTTLSGMAVPLLIADINTDVIIRIERVATCPRAELGKWAFEALRYDPQGLEISDFILNRAPFRTAQILLAGPNFGCGSSREMAVWALQEFGIRCVIAPSFGDIFFSNCFQNGVLAIKLPQNEVELLATLSHSSGAMMSVDLSSCVIQVGAENIPFHVDPLARESLLAGSDQIALTLNRESEIAAFEKRNRKTHPWLHSLDMNK